MIRKCGAGERRPLGLFWVRHLELMRSQKWSHVFRHSGDWQFVFTLPANHSQGLGLDLIEGTNT